jgi:hypothetical protein
MSVDKLARLRCEVNMLLGALHRLRKAVRKDECHEHCGDQFLKIALQDADAAIAVMDERLHALRCGWCGGEAHADGVHCSHCNSIGCELRCDCGAGLPDGRVVLPSLEGTR